MLNAIHRTRRGSAKNSTGRKHGGPKSEKSSVTPREQDQSGAVHTSSIDMIEKENILASDLEEGDVWPFPFSKYPMQDHYKNMAVKANNEKLPFPEGPYFDTDADCV